MNVLATLLLARAACTPTDTGASPGADAADLAALDARLDALEAAHAADVAALEAAHAADIDAVRAEHAADVEALGARVDALEAALAVEEARSAALEAAVVALDEAVVALEDAAGGGGAGVPESVARLGEVLTVDASGDLVLDGVNLWIRSGAGATDAAPNGKGNLLLGYGEALGGEARTGSHTLVVGMYNDWTTSFGLVVGTEHLLGGAGGAVLGGSGGTVSGEGSVTIAGSNSTATHRYAVNLGGSGLISSWDCGARTSGISSGSGC